VHRGCRGKHIVISSTPVIVLVCGHVIGFRSCGEKRFLPGFARRTVLAIAYIQLLLCSSPILLCYIGGPSFYEARKSDVRYCMENMRTIDIAWMQYKDEHPMGWQSKKYVNWCPHT